MPAAAAIHIDTDTDDVFGKAYAFNRETGQRVNLATTGTGGGEASRVRSSASATPTLLATDEVVLLTNAAARTVAGGTVTAAANKGRIFVFKDAAGTGASAAVTFDPAGSELIDGAATKAVIGANYGTARVISDGTNWLTL